MSSEANQCKRTAESQSRFSRSNFLQRFICGIFHVSAAFILNSNQNYFAAINRKHICLLRTHLRIICAQYSTVDNNPEESRMHTQGSDWKCSDNFIIRDDTTENLTWEKYHSKMHAFSLQLTDFHMCQNVAFFRISLEYIK